MDSLQALQNLDAAASLAPLPRQQHALTVQSVATLRGVIDMVQRLQQEVVDLKQAAKPEQTCEDDPAEDQEDETDAADSRE